MFAVEVKYLSFIHATFSHICQPLNWGNNQHVHVQYVCIGWEMVTTTGLDLFIFFQV